MTHRIINADVLDGLASLPDESVQVCVTSPPYLGLRDYGTASWEGGSADCDHLAQDESRGDGDPKSCQPRGKYLARDICPKCGARRIDRQIGLEPTLDAYIAKMVEVFREVRRVLRRDGTCWLNLGDSYVANKTGDPTAGSTLQGGKANQIACAERPDKKPGGGLKPKDLMMVPARVALALQADGWWLRSDIIWCLSGGTWLYTRTQKGDMPMAIKDMARLDPRTVQLWNGEKWCQVLGWSKSKRKGNEGEIVLRSGERISCTPSHQFPTERGLLRADELRVGDILKRTILPDPSPVKSASAIGRDAAWLIGLYIAEGSRSGDTIQIAGHSKETERWDRLCRIAQMYGGSITRTIDGNKMDIRLYGKLLNALIDQYVSGKTAKDKGLTTAAWQHGADWLDELLQGYLSGDGHWDKANKRWRLGFTRNYNWERDLRGVCARLGCRLILNLSTSTIYAKEYPAFRGEIRFARSGHHNCQSENEVVELRKARCREVYDIGVEGEPHLFALASGILTHNSKPNPMPESCQDRPTSSYEHIFLLTKSARYYYDQYATREKSTKDYSKERWVNEDGELIEYPFDPDECAGRNSRNVWTIPTAPFAEAHFATFAPELVRRCLLAGLPKQGCCPKCGKGWERVVETEYGEDSSSTNHIAGGDRTIGQGWEGTQRRATVDQKSLGFRPGCECPEAINPVPSVVLDPFGGSMTTLIVALRMGADAIGIELSQEYARMGEARIAKEVGGLFQSQ